MATDPRREIRILLHIYDVYPVGLEAPCSVSFEAKQSTSVDVVIRELLSRLPPPPPGPFSITTTAPSPRELRTGDGTPISRLLLFCSAKQLTLRLIVQSPEKPAVTKTSLSQRLRGALGIGRPRNTADPAPGVVSSAPSRPAVREHSIQLPVYDEPPTYEEVRRSID